MLNNLEAASLGSLEINVPNDYSAQIGSEFDNIPESYTDTFGNIYEGGYDEYMKFNGHGINEIGDIPETSWYETNVYTDQNYPEYNGEQISIFDIGEFENIEENIEPLTLESLKEKIRIGEESIAKSGQILNQLYMYRNNNTEYISIKGFEHISTEEAIFIYEQIVFAGALSLRATELGVEDWSNGKSEEFNYEASRNFIVSQREGGKIDINSLGGVYGFIAELEGLSEHNKNDKIKLKKILGFNPAKTAWCSGIVKIALKKNGFSEANSRLDLTAASSLGFKNITGAHVGIADGMGGFISGNTLGGRVASSMINLNRMYGWVLPQYAGLKNKVHWASEGVEPPAGAIVLVQQGGKVIEKIRRESGEWPN